MTKQIVVNGVSIDMITEQEFIKIYPTLSFRPFTWTDWEQYMGCETENPLISSFVSETGVEYDVIVDGNNLVSVNPYTDACYCDDVLWLEPKQIFEQMKKQRKQDLAVHGIYLQ